MWRVSAKLKFGRGDTTRTGGGEISGNDAGEQPSEVENGLLSLGRCLLDVNEQVGRNGSDDGQGALVALPPICIALCASGIGHSSATLEGGPEGGEGGRLEGINEGLRRVSVSGLVDSVRLRVNIPW